MAQTFVKKDFDRVDHRAHNLTRIKSHVDVDLWTTPGKKVRRFAARAHEVTRD